MHKLLSRQLRKYRGSEEVSEDWKTFIEAVDDAYTKADDDYMMLEQSLDYTSKELLQRNEEVAQAFKELGEAQVQLVQSSKMVALGQLIAGIAHEVNTPAGCIAGAIEEIEQDYGVMLTHLIELVGKLNPAEMETYLAAYNQLQALEKNVSTSDQRKLAREMEETLSSQGIENARSFSKRLASIGFTNEKIADLTTLFKSAQADQITQSLFDLGMSQIHVSDIRIAIGRIISIVKALKLYTHFDQESYGPTNIKEDLENTLIILQNKIKRAVTIQKEFEEIPPVTCYADQLNQIWTNLINNSIEAMKGEGNVILRLKKQDEENIMVEIEDNGPGIPADVLPKIFDPYFTTKAKGEGTGLGLSISKDIITKQHGTLTVETKPGQTIFRVSVPITVPVIEKEELK